MLDLLVLFVAKLNNMFGSSIICQITYTDTAHSGGFPVLILNTFKAYSKPKVIGGSETRIPISPKNVK